MYSWRAAAVAPLAHHGLLLFTEYNLFSPDVYKVQCSVLFIQSHFFTLAKQTT